MDDKDLLDALDSGAFNPVYFRRRPNGQWEYFHQADGPTNNQWKQYPDLRSCLVALKGNNDTLSAKRAAAKAARLAAQQKAAAAKVAARTAAKVAKPTSAASPKPASAAAPGVARSGAASQGASPKPASPAGTPATAAAK